MEGEVAAEDRMDDGVAVASVIGWMDGFHAGIEAKDEEVEVHTETESVGYGYLAIEVVETEGASRLVGIVANGPDVAGIDEEGTVELPEEEGSVFDAEVELQVTRLVDEVDTAIGSVVGTWSQRAYRPSSYAVGSSCEIAFLERQDVGITIRISDTDGCMDGYRVVLVDAETLREVEVTLDILCVGDAAEHSFAVVRVFRVDECRESAEQVACGLNVQLQGIGILAVGRCVGRTERVVGVGVAEFGDEEVLVVILQDGVGLAQRIEVLLLEGLRYPRHVDIVDFEQVESVDGLLAGRFCMLYCSDISEVAPCVAPNRLLTTGNRNPGKPRVTSPPHSM